MGKQGGRVRLQSEPPNKSEIQTNSGAKMKNKRFSHTFARSLATKRKLVCLLIVAVLVPAMVVAQEPWNGLVATDMDSMAATRDVSRNHQKERLRIDGLVAAHGCAEEGLA
jgi:hypothetical protein